MLSLSVSGVVSQDFRSYGIIWSTMRVNPKDTTHPLSFEEMHPEIQAVCSRLLDGLKAALDDNLYGIYLYGAMVFPEMRYVQDIDFHVIVNRKLTDPEKEAIKKLHDELSKEFAFPKDDLDGYYILLEDARKISTPWHQVYPDIPDEAWPLHIAHMKAGYCIALYGPAPNEFLPEPTWQDLIAGLEASMKHTRINLDRHPAYCVLNLCRLLYSYKTQDVVISKRGAAEWTINHFPDWEELIGSALRVFEREEKNEDLNLLQSRIHEFYRFIIAVQK